jgi:hypothetical protein
MGIFARLMGIESDAERKPAAGSARELSRPSLVDADQQALERYRYMLRTAPPDTLEQAHAEAFAKLSTEQRRRLLAELAESAPVVEKATIAATPVDDPQALARVATRAEVREPGILERTMGSGAAGFGANLLSSFAMGFVGSMVAQSFFSSLGGFGDSGGVADSGGVDDKADPGTRHEAYEDEALADDGGGFDDDGGGDDFDV